MEFLKPVYGNEYQIIDIFNKKKYQIIKSEREFYKSKLPTQFHLAEVPVFPSPIIIDVDIKQKGRPLEKLYDDFMIKEIVLSYTTILNDFLIDPPQEYKIVLLEKPPRTTENGITKNGFHLHFLSISLSKQDLDFVFNKVLEISEFSDLLDNVSGKPWLLYGAIKHPVDDPHPYKITKGITIINEKINYVPYQSLFIGEEYLDEKITKKNIDNMLVSLMSIRNFNSFSLQIPSRIDYNKIPQTQRESTELENISIYREPKETNTIYIHAVKIIELVLLLNQERSENYEDWLRVAMILTNIAKSKPEDEQEILETGFHTFSMQSSLYDQMECQRKWNSLFISSKLNRGLGIGSLIYYVKQDIPTFNLKSILNNYSTECIPTNDYDIAICVKNSITDLYITHALGCFKYNNTYWEEIPYHENILKKFIEDWFADYKPKITEKIDRLNDSVLMKIAEKTLKVLTKKVMNYSSRNSILKSLIDVLNSKSASKLFEQKTNLVAFNNCVFSVNKWEIVPGEPLDYLSTKIDHDYIPWSSVSKKDQDLVLDFWKKIFPDEELREYCIELFARPITGQNALKQFPFWTGVGNNGKSVCVKLLENIFKKMVMKIPKSLIIGGQAKVGGLNPELSRLKFAKFAFIDEVTLNDILDPGQIKGLTGNDSLYVRDLYQSSKEINEIIPYFIPNVITNSIPIIKKPDEATWNRIRLINFESVFTRDVDAYIKSHPDVDPTKVFESDPNIYTFIKDHAKYFLSYFMFKLESYRSFSHFNEKEKLPEKVMTGLETFKQGQNSMKQYLDENFIVDSSSHESITIQKITREYNASRPKFTLCIEDVKAALENYKLIHNSIIVTEEKIFGLKRGD